MSLMEAFLFVSTTVQVEMILQAMEYEDGKISSMFKFYISFLFNLNK